MKAIRKSLYMAVLTGSVGCVTLPTTPEKAETPPPKPVVVTQQPVPRPRPPVVADQVTDSNAHEKAEALRLELDREAQREAAIPRDTTSGGSLMGK